MKVSLQRRDLDSHELCALEVDMQLWWKAPSKGEGRSLSSLLSHSCIPDVSPYSRMEKLGSEIATIFTHSHVVSLVVSSQRSSSSPFHPIIPPSGSGRVVS